MQPKWTFERVIHLFEMITIHNWVAHAHDLRIKDDTASPWMKNIGESCDDLAAFGWAIDDNRSPWANDSGADVGRVIQMITYPGWAGLANWPVGSRSRHPPGLPQPCGSGGGHFEFPPHSCLSLTLTLHLFSHLVTLVVCSPSLSLAACPRVSTTSVPETLRVCIIISFSSRLWWAAISPCLSFSAVPWTETFTPGRLVMQWAIVVHKHDVAIYSWWTTFIPCLTAPFLFFLWNLLQGSGIANEELSEGKMPQIQYSEKYFDDTYEYRCALLNTLVLKVRESLP